MDYEVVERIDIAEFKDVGKKIGPFVYFQNTDTLYFESPWWFPVQLAISEGLTKCKVTPMFLKLPFILKGWINLDILLRMIELLKLAKEGKILMHGSCVTNNEDSTKGGDLIVGLPNAGKTYQTYKRVSEGDDLISEEYTVIYKSEFGNWWAKPYKRTMRTCFSKKTMEVCGMEMSLHEKVWLAMATLREKLFPFMYEAVIWKEIPASGIEDKIHRIFYGSTGREVKDWKEFAILCENEFPFMANEFLQAYALATGFDLIGIQEKQRNLIKEFVNAVYPSSK